MDSAGTLDLEKNLDNNVLKAWEKHKDKLRNRIRKCIGKTTDIDDLLQNLFIKVYRNKKNIPLEYAEQYLMRAATNLARDYLRDLSRRREEVELPGTLRYADCIDSITPEKIYLIKEQEEYYSGVVELALERLSPEQREAVLAFAHSGNLKAEAQKRGINYSTFRSRYSSGIGELKRCLRNS